MNQAKGISILEPVPQISNGPGLYLHEPMVGPDFLPEQSKGKSELLASQGKPLRCCQTDIIDSVPRTNIIFFL